MANYTLSRTMIIAIAAVVGLVVIAAAVLFFMGGGNDSNDNGDDASWHVGDYVEWGYYYYENGSVPGEPYAYQRYTVTEVGATWLTINESTYNAPLDQGGVLTYWTVTHVLTNSTGFGFSADNLIYLGFSVTDLGIDTVTTEWGELSAEHYQYQTESSGTIYTTDVWTRSGFYLIESTANDSDNYVLMKMVTSTNIERIYT